MNSNIERMVTALADRVRNLEIWKAEQILLARDGKLPSLDIHPSSPVSVTSIAALVQEIQKNPLNAMCDKEEEALNYAAFRAGNSFGKTETIGSQVEEILAGQTESPLKGVHQSDLTSTQFSIQGPENGSIGISVQVSTEMPERSLPVGWVSGTGPMARDYPHRDEDILHQKISPDPSIPWGEKYEAILPEEAEDSDEGFLPKSETVAEGWYKRTWILPARRMGIPWRRRKSPAPAEPAPGSDQDHPPLGYRRAPVGGWMEKGYLFWCGTGKWESGGTLHGRRISETEFPIANPIPANEGDSQKEVAELRATVDRLTAERDELRGKLAKVAEVVG